MLASLSCGLLLSQLNTFCVFSRVCHIGIDKALPTHATYCLWAAPSAARPVHVGDASHISSSLGGHIGRTHFLMVRRVASLGPVADGWCVAIQGVD